VEFLSAEGICAEKNPESAKSTLSEPPDISLGIPSALKIPGYFLCVKALAWNSKIKMD